MDNLDNLREIINNPNTSADNRRLAEEMLQQEEDRLAAIGGARVQLAAGATQNEAELAAILDAMKSLLQKKGGSGNVSVADVRKAVNDELALRKINIGDLSPDLLKFLDSKRAVSLTVRTLSATTTQTTDSDFINRPLVQKLLCDMEAKNNSYLYGGAGTGKAQPLTAKILCEEGWKTFADIKVGDKVYGEDGKLYQVSGVYDRGVKSVYRSYMNDGAYTDTCNEHLWQVATRSQRNKGNQGNVLKLSDFMHKIKTDNGNANAFIPVPKSISFSEKSHIIHPYTLGVLIGDGNLTVENRIMISNPSEEIFENLILPLENKLSKIPSAKNCLTYSIVKKQHNTDNVLVCELKKVGLSGKKSIQKFIPKEYLYDSLENRVELLQGLNDTDGYCDGTTFEYSTSSIQLAEDYCELVRGLGGIARSVKRRTFYTHNGERKEGEESYRIYCVFPDNIMPFKYSEKKNRFKHHSKYKVKRFFDRVEYLGEMPVRCISVTNPSKLYITDNYIVTHNTFVAEQIAKALGWELITINCNQYTSPTEILGGQTIDGYQEGKLVLAWRNVMIKPDGSEVPFSEIGKTGCILLLDELPKIDPNTAGILNDALAKVKQPNATITNGKNEKFTIKNLYIIATGNVKLNTIDPDYEANFKQDLSLQDRFVGSTYEIFLDYDTEAKTMKGFLFIWLYLVKVREKIKEIRATGQAFVSMRLMLNARETYKVYRDILEKQNSKSTGGTYLITQPKTLIETMDNFFLLFKDSQKEILKRDTGYEEFKRVVAKKLNMDFNAAKPDFDTSDEESEKDRLVEKNKQEIRQMYN